MPLVFVHGVNNRADNEFYRNEKVRDGFFKSIALTGHVGNPAGVDIKNPYWGDDAAKIAWNHACLPEGDFESFGAGDDRFA